MPDHFSETYEWDENGLPRRKQRVLPDGAHVHFRYLADDAAYGFQPTFSDGTPDFTSPPRKGFRFADTNDAAKLAAEEAYEQMRRRLSDAYRRKGEPAAANASPTPTRTLDQLQALAEQAWKDRNKRVQNAWRHRDGDEESGNGYS
jgi:hypothetical protein